MAQRRCNFKVSRTTSSAVPSQPNGAQVTTTTQHAQPMMSSGYPLHVSFAFDQAMLPPACHNLGRPGRIQHVSGFPFASLPTSVESERLEKRHVSEHPHCKSLCRRRVSLDMRMHIPYRESRSARRKPSIRAGGLETAKKYKSVHSNSSLTL